MKQENNREAFADSSLSYIVDFEVTLSRQLSFGISLCMIEKTSILMSCCKILRWAVTR